MITQQIKQGLNDRGVSPVIGVILMVAITVILAAVIGSFVLGIGGDIQQAPQASLSYQDTSGSGGEIIHQGGETLDISSSGPVVIKNGSDTNWNPDTSLEPGQTITVSETGTYRVVHQPSGNIIAEIEVESV